MDTVIYKLVISLLLGSFIGLERQIAAGKDRGNNYKSSLGLRTFSLITTMGTICGMLFYKIPVLFTIVSIGVILLIISYYFIDSFYSKDTGITTETSLIFSYVIGALIAFDIFSIQIIIGITVIIASILSFKEQMSIYIKSIKSAEMQSFIRYAIIALVILPLLPNTEYQIKNLPYIHEISKLMNLPFKNIQNIIIINPFNLWLIVALVTGIDVFGYILEKTFGKRHGWYIKSLIAGFVSSTATTQSLALESKRSKTINLLIASAILANLASFVQLTLLIFPINFILFVKVIPVILFMIIGSIILLYFFKKADKSSARTSRRETISGRAIFKLSPALKFAVLFVSVKFLSSIALTFLGNSGFLATIALGAIFGVDAALITIAQNAGTTISLEYALIAFILANAVNLAAKSVFSFIQGKKEFAIKFSFCAALILGCGIAGILIQR